MKKILFGLGLTLTLVGAGCIQFNADWTSSSDTPPNTTSDVVAFTADEIASIMLYEVDVLGRVFAVRPQVVQFNGTLDEANDGSDYYVARVWLDELTGETAVTEAITQYVSPEQAEAQIIELAGDNERVQPARYIGDTFLVYTTPASATEPMSVTYRFTVEQYGVRMTVFDRGTDTQDDLLELVSDLAGTQLTKFGDALVSGVTLSNNPAIQYLPADISGADYLGTSFVTAEEWLGTTYDLESEGIDGFVTGGVARWQLQSRPEEVVEVVVMEMDSEEAAASYAAGLIPSLPEATEITLPESIAAVADAVSNEAGQLVELQASQDNYMIDISILAPLGEVNLEAAAEELVTIAEEVLTGTTTTISNTITTTDAAVYPDVTSDQLALALFTPADVAAEVAGANPLPLEFNGQLDENLVGENFYVGRLWNDSDGQALVGNAITQYTSAEAAQANVDELAANCNLELLNVVGDVTYLCYDDPLIYYGGPSDPAVLVYRFTMGQYGVRIDVTDTGFVGDDDSVIYDRLYDSAYALGLAQQDRLNDVLADTSLAVEQTPSVTMLPTTLDGATVMGTGALTDAEWMTLTGDTADELNGFTSGAIRRFSLAERPDEVLEVIVMEFATAEQAEALAADFASPTDGIAETQKVKDYFFYDISIFSPFGELDFEAASTDLEDYAAVIGV